MNWYLTRVELHGAKHGEWIYEMLHAYMERQGFCRSIMSDDGSTYHLPPAEYRFAGFETIEQIHGRASLAAAQTGYSYAVLVAHYDRARWIGLLPV